MHDVASAALLSDRLPAEYFSLDAPQRYVVCSFYTPDYAPTALRLKRSLDALGINHYFKRYPHQGSWEANTRLKPAFIRHCLDAFPGHDVLYVDADAVVRQPLDFIDRIGGSDVALYLHPRKRKGRWYLRITASVVFIRNNDKGRAFIDGWSDAEKVLGHLAVDEDMLQLAFAGYEGLTFTILPASYIKIFDESNVVPVIEHYQASRSVFNWRRCMRKSRQIASYLLGALVVLSAIYLIR